METRNESSSIFRRAWQLSVAHGVKKPALLLLRKRKKLREVVNVRHKLKVLLRVKLIERLYRSLGVTLGTLLPIKIRSTPEPKMLYK